MQIYRFLRKDVLKLVEHVKSSTKFWHPYEECNVPGLLLVGDRGVYLMSNGNPGLPNPKKSKPRDFNNYVVYARGMNPHRDTDYLTNRYHIYGGNDGCDFLPLDEVLEELNEQNGLRYYIVAFSNKPGSIE